jgi:diguanylate cyclase (GGDEF)-like protein
MRGVVVVRVPEYSMAPPRLAKSLPPELASLDQRLPWDGVPEPLSLVGVFERADEIEALSGMLAQLNCTPVAGLSPEGTPLPLPPQGLMAAVISDRVAAPLELCTSLALRCPTILIAGETSFELQLAAARARVDAVLPRPVDVGELGEWLEHFSGKREPSTPSVMIVDDDPLLSEVFAEALRMAGMIVSIVSDPTEALARLTMVLPDLILMDMHMPGVDGIELARMIRQSRRHLSLPIIFLSAEQDANRQMQARRWGGDDFIAKPIEPQRLASLVRLKAERSGALRSMMERDSLTGLYNHGRFKDRLAHEIERCRRTRSEISLAMIDLDHFKHINDRFGHLIGDNIIRALANTLTTGLRRIDVIGRYGGEEFGVILIETPPQAARLAIDKLRQRFAELPFEAAGSPFGATFSAGIAGSRSHGSLNQLIAAADRALYAAKHAGRNQVMTDPGMIDAAAC